MIRALILAAPLAFAACASQPSITITPPKVTTGPTTASTPTPAATANESGGLAQITHQDLQTAIQIATAANKTVDVQCFTFLDNQLTSLQGAGSGFIPPTGAISAFETGRIGGEKLQSGLLTPAQRTALDLACGPMILSIQGDLVGLMNALGLQAATTGILLPKL